MSTTTITVDGQQVGGVRVIGEDVSWSAEPREDVVSTPPRRTYTAKLIPPRRGSLPWRNNMRTLAMVFGDAALPRVLKPLIHNGRKPTVRRKR